MRVLTGARLLQEKPPFRLVESLRPSTPHIEVDAKEFGEHVRNGGWKLGLFVARSVEQIGRGRPRKSEHSDFSKVGASTFAHRSGARITDKTVTKYLDAWNAASEDPDTGIPHSSTLAPGQSFTFDDETHTPELWNRFFSAPGEERDPFLSQVNKLKSAGMINPAMFTKDAFEDQFEFSVDDVYQFASALIRIGNQVGENCREIAETSGYRINLPEEEV